MAHLEGDAETVAKIESEFNKPSLRVKFMDTESISVDTAYIVSERVMRAYFDQPFPVLVMPLSVKDRFGKDWVDVGVARGEERPIPLEYTGPIPEAY